MPTFKVRGVVIRRSDFSEADRFITVFTRERGKLRILAKGVRRINSRRGGNLDLLNEALLSVSRGRTFNLVTEAEVIRSFSRIKKSLKFIVYTFYLCELIDSLCPEEQPLPEVFDLLVSTLEGLSNDSHRKIWNFEQQLLQQLGFVPPIKFGKSLRPYIERIVERELKSPKFYYSLLKSPSKSPS